MSELFEESDEPAIAFEDPRFLVVRKPCRMHSAPGAGSGDLCAWVFERYPEAAAVRAPDSPALPRRRDREGGLLHRLDGETSGLVLFARDDRFFASLLRQQEEGRFLKEYAALSCLAESGSPRGSRPERGHPLGIDATTWSEFRAGGKLEQIAEAIAAARASGSEPRVECAFRPYGPGRKAVACLGLGGEDRAKGAAYRSDLLGARLRPSLFGAESGPAIELRLGLAKGFRHQLRAQLAWIGLPILGDPLYGAVPARRLFLSASRIAFADPDTGTPMLFGSDGPESFGLEGPSGAMGGFASLLFGPKADRLVSDG